MKLFAKGKSLHLFKHFCIPFFMVMLCVVAHGQSLQFRQLSVENGLSQNAVMSMVQDKKGFLWYGTRYGLNRYDGIHFKVYKNVTGNNRSLSNNIINALLVDVEGVLWVGTSSGLNRYDEEKDDFLRVAASDTTRSSLTNNYISFLYEDHNKNIWVGADNGLNMLTDRKLNRFSHRSDFIGNRNRRGNFIRVIFEDSYKTLWIGTSTGLVSIRNSSHPDDFRIYKHQEGRPQSISADYITSLCEDQQHQLWVGTLHNGINLFHPADSSFSHYDVGNTNIRKLLLDKSGQIWVGTQDGLGILDPVTKQSRLYQHDPENKTSLSNNSIHSLYQDRHQTIWIGTYHGGVNVAYANTTPFTVYQNNRLPSSISSNVVSSMAEDVDHGVWIGTEGGGLNYFDPIAGSFNAFRYNANDSSSISSNLIKIVYRDKNNHIWAGTSYGGGLNLFDAVTKRFKRISIETSNREAVSFDEVLSIQEDNNGTLWVGAQSGLTQLTAQNGQYPNRTSPSPLNIKLPNKNINALFKDSKGNMWIGTSAGLHRYDLFTKKLTSFFKNDSVPNSLPTDYINVITEDSKGHILVGCFYGGLNIYDPASSKFSTYLDKDGLPNNNVLGILEDNNSNLWLSTDNGLSKFDPVNKTFKNYTTSDGLAGNKFTNVSFLKSSDGLFYFGGNNGLTAFMPEKIGTNGQVSPIVFTGLKLFGNAVDVNGSEELLQQNIVSTNELVFSHDQSNFTIDYALLNYIKPEKNHYAYMLEGIEKKWNYVTTTSATYNNLPAGNYTLLVKGANNDGVWNETPAMLHIKILPPIWKTWWAYTLYLIVLVGIVFLILRFFWLRALFQREHDLQQFKLNFFTNISHEIRTHLTLISGPVEKLLSSEKADGFVSKQLGHVKVNADRLLNLVGELIDFRKAETNNLPLHATKENIVSFIEEIFTSFQDMAFARNIKISFVYESKHIEVYFDRRQMEKVIFNLLTNAFKFTNDGGFIEVSIGETASTVTVKITDNGKGIAPENLKKLFVNFFQVDEEHSHNTGYGIGLALSKSIVELHHGKLAVESEPAKEGMNGKTTFAIELLKGQGHFDSAQLLTSTAPIASFQEHVANYASHDEPLMDANRKPLVLLVEDNHELRSFIKESLDIQYEIMECVNGKEGWEVAINQIPDLIISDVMMPEMDGISLCNRLKKDERTNHIPVILLTARASQDNQIEGLENGADAYITKPFSIQLLELQSRNLVASRIALRQKYSRQIMLEPKHVEVSNVQEDFLNKVMAIIEENMDDPEFSVAVLSTKIAMSQPVLYKKLKALTDMTVNEFIKSVRIKKAALLLQQKQLNVTEVAYAVGFSRRKHFSEEFKKHFGKTPSEFIGEVEEEG